MVKLNTIMWQGYQRLFKFMKVYLFFLRFAEFTDVYKVLVSGLFTVNIDTRAMIPSFTSFTKNPNHSSFRPKTFFFSNGTTPFCKLFASHLARCPDIIFLQFYPKTLTNFTLTKKRPLVPRTLRFFFNCLLFWQFLQLRELSCVVFCVVSQFPTDVSLTSA